MLSVRTNYIVEWDKQKIKTLLCRASYIIHFLMGARFVVSMPVFFIYLVLTKTTLINTNL